MHLLLCITSVIFALLWRYGFPAGSLGFLVPPLLFISTTIVVLLMGYEGEMWMMAVGGWGFGVALGFCGFCVLSLVIHFVDLHRSVQKVEQLPLHRYSLKDQEISFRYLDHDLPFAGLVGCVNPQLVLSRGLLELLDKDHLDSVIYHEEAHRFYGDCFWFFCLGYLKRITAFLPRTERLWQSLLLEREIRADRKAAETIDSLYIAESLLQIIAQGNKLIFSGAIPFFEQNRLEQRIAALLSPPTDRFYLTQILFSIFLALLPLFYLPFHH